MATVITAEGLTASGVTLEQAGSIQAAIDGGTKLAATIIGYSGPIETWTTESTVIVSKKNDQVWNSTATDELNAINTILGSGPS